MRMGQVILRVNSVILSTDAAVIPAHPDRGRGLDLWPPLVPVLALSTITGNVNVKLEVKAISTDKTQFSAYTGGRLIAELKRTA